MRLINKQKLVVLARALAPQVNPNNLVERLELLILETKAGHDGLYDVKLNISKQLLSMKIINQEQLDSFILNKGK